MEPPLLGMMIPPVLLIPGNMCDDRLWRPVAERLEGAGRTVCHAPRLDQNSIGEMAEVVGRTVDRSAVVVGFSMGAIVAAELARRAPKRVAALGLVAFNATADLPERAAVRPRQQAAVRGGQLETLVADELKPNYLADENRGDRMLLDTVMEMARALGPEAFVAQSEALRLREDLRPALPGFPMPVLLACGIEDRLCPPEWHRRWAEMIGRRASFMEVSGAGHLLPLERPLPLADALIGWLAEDTQCNTVS
jgi:pimeloyl-ACP methyl ester carboxylesterase